MSLLNNINGDLLFKLASAGSKSSGSGKTSSPTSNDTFIDAATLSKGLKAGQTKFAQSSIRLSNAIAVVRQTKEALTDLHKSSEEMLTIVSRATDPNITEQERARLNSKLQNLVDKYKDDAENASKGQTNFLDKDDLSELLLKNGVSVNKASKLSDAFSALGGKDDKVGSVTVALSSVIDAVVGTNANISDGISLLSGGDALDVSVSSLGGALISQKALEKVKEDLETDMELVDSVAEELSGGKNFAISAYTAFGKELETLAGDANAEAVARELVRSIRSLSKDISVGAHSDIDRDLAAALLG